VAPINSLIVLRSSGSPNETNARSTLEAGLTTTEVEDLERYLDVTRGELLFAKGVILVEGEAETYLVPAFSKVLGYELDELGISVCSVAGTNFLPFVKLLDKKSLAIPFSIITDEDPMEGKSPLAHNRVRSLVTNIDPEYDYSNDTRTMLNEATADGIFVTPHTLEVAIFKCGRKTILTKTIEELSRNKMARQRAESWRGNPGSLDADKLLADIEAIGKGRFAQRLASRIAKAKGDACPDSVKEAIAHVAEQV
jgi:putative ATP-dependent endonuclease of OLD family